MTAVGHERLCTRSPCCRIWPIWWLDFAFDIALNGLKPSCAREAVARCEFQSGKFELVVTSLYFEIHYLRANSHGVGDARPNSFFGPRASSRGVHRPLIVLARTSRPLTGYVRPAPGDPFPLDPMIGDPRPGDVDPQYVDAAFGLNVERLLDGLPRPVACRLKSKVSWYAPGPGMLGSGRTGDVQSPPLTPAGCHVGAVIRECVPTVALGSVVRVASICRPTAPSLNPSTSRGACGPGLDAPSDWERSSRARPRVWRPRSARVVLAPMFT